LTKTLRGKQLLGNLVAGKTHTLAQHPEQCRVCLGTNIWNAYAT